MEIITLFAIILVPLVYLFIGKLYLDKQILKITDTTKAVQEAKANPQIGAVLADLNTSGYSIIRIDPDSMLIRNRLR